MTLDSMDKLLEKYYEGQTNIEEEKILKQYFSDRDIVGVNDQELFKAILEIKNINPKSSYFTSAQIKEKVPFVYILRKVAAILVLCSLLLTVLCIHVYNVEQTTKAANLNHKSENDLLNVSRILNDSYDDINNSIEPMVKIKIEK